MFYICCHILIINLIKFNTMNTKKYVCHITQEQLDSIEHYKNMFELNANLVVNLCDSAKDDIVYGFELGKMHTHLRECYINMSNLIDEIQKQQILDDNN